MDRMLPHEMEFFRTLSREGEPQEARIFLDLFHYFPGIRMEEVPREKTPERPKPIDPQTMPFPEGF